MSYNTKESLKIGGAIIGCCLVLVGLIYLLTRDTALDMDYDFHADHVQGASSWSPGTFESAKRVVTEIMTRDVLKPGDISLLANDLRAWEVGPKEKDGFDWVDIVYNGTYMLLSKKDFAAYNKWLKEISKPYANHTKMLSPPLMPPPWNVLER